MTTSEANPFHELFVTDSAPAEDFVRYFSPFLVPHLPELFNDGNVVLKGTQGCGKSMLLKLFQPEIRVTYAEKKVEFPVPKELCNFIGAGVNLSKSGLLDLAQIFPQNPKETDYQNYTSLFCDFLNYWLLRDLLKSLSYIASKREIFGELVSAAQFDHFVEQLRVQDCWFDYLHDCRTFISLKERVNERVLTYRMWNAHNIERLSSSIERSKTVIGEPLSRTVECLKSTGVIDQKVPVFLRIDQMEELWHRDSNQELLTQYFRKAINRVIGNRDLRVSFRIGTRRYAWSENLAMPGGRQIEEFRDYLVIDLDQRLRRREDRSGWLFGGFAADVFQHRIIDSSSKHVDSSKVLSHLNSFFGKSPTPHTLIEKLIVSPPEIPQKILKLDDKWSPEWIKYIEDIYFKRLDRKSSKIGVDYKYNPLDAIMATAWGLQTGGITSAMPRRANPPPKVFPPWTPWWEKERLMLAVIHLVTRHQQNLFWWGTEKVLALSASNITLFLSICREVWDQWKRRAPRDTDLRSSNGLNKEYLPVPWKTQAVAIDNISKSWHRTFARQPGRPGGDIRMRFVDEAGNWLRRKMLSDTAMSYPGGNGFSLRNSDLTKYPPLAHLLEEAVGWGDLYEVEHTTKQTKEKHRDPRKKYYLNPILSPMFQIPEAHTKEPLYENVEVILKLAMEARALMDNQSRLPFGELL